MGSRWHHWELEKVFSALHSQPTGISYTSARRRIRKGKPSRLVFLCLTLVLGGMLFFPSIRSVITSPFGLSSIAVLGLQGLIYRSLVLIRSRQAPKSKVVIVKRDGRYIVIPSRSLAEGDIICLQPGEDLEADIRLVVLKDLVIAKEEGGKWQIQRKDTTAPLPLDIPRSDHSNMVYYGSLVVSGEAVGIVVKTHKTPPPLPLLSHFPFFYYLFTGWLILGILLIWLYLPFPIVAGLFVFSVPCHWLSMLEFCLNRGTERLQREAIIIRSPFLLWSLSMVDQILWDCNNYEIHGADLGVGWYGLCHGEKDLEKEQGEIPMLHFMPGMALPFCQSLALVSDTLGDQELFSKVDVAMTSSESESAMQRQCGVVLGQKELKLVEQTINYSRVTIDRVYRILSFSLTCGLSLLFLLVMGKSFQLTTITPLQTLWSGIFIPTSLSLLLLIEPWSDVALPRNSRFLALIWVRNLSLSILMICLATIVVFRFTTVSLAWSVFNFSLLALGSSLLRVSFWQFYQWIIAIVGIVILQVLWVQMGMLPLDLVRWSIAVVIASGVFWLNELLRFNHQLGFLDRQIIKLSSKLRKYLIRGKGNGTKAHEFRK